MDDVRDALAARLTVRDIHETLVEEGRVEHSYDLFRQHVNRFIRGGDEGAQGTRADASVVGEAGKTLATSPSSPMEEEGLAQKLAREKAKRRGG